MSESHRSGCPVFSRFRGRCVYCFQTAQKDGENGISDGDRRCDLLIAIVGSISFWWLRTSKKPVPRSELHRPNNRHYVRQRPHRQVSGRDIQACRETCLP